MLNQDLFQTEHRVIHLLNNEMSVVDETVFPEKGPEEVKGRRE